MTRFATETGRAAQGKASAAQNAQDAHPHDASRWVDSAARPGGQSPRPARTTRQTRAPNGIGENLDPVARSHE